MSILKTNIIQPNTASSLTVRAWDGWMDADETWTYASASTFTVAADVTTKYCVGMKIKFTQTVVKYFIITDVAYAGGVTTITVTGGGTYTISNAAITNNYYSTDKYPMGFPVALETSYNVDSSAIHKATAAEISAITSKSLPVGSDYMLIEDSADSNAKKSITIGKIPYLCFMGPMSRTIDLAGTITANYLTATRFFNYKAFTPQAIQIQVYQWSNGAKCKLGIYAHDDTNSRPTGSVLMQTSEIVSVGKDDRTYYASIISPISLNANTYYWIAIILDTNMSIMLYTNSSRVTLGQYWTSVAYSGGFPTITSQGSAWVGFVGAAYA